ncbi:MAG: helix-turn-helix transcriptional regulator [Bacteroidia bacterium]|jgi:DNA-binding CsgD family transcriptional regulator
MKSENSILDYPLKNHFVIKKKADKEKSNSARVSSGSELHENKPLFFFDCCLVDHSGKQFACIYEHCHRCFHNDLLNETHEFHALQFHPEDRKLWEENVFPDIIRFINSIPPNEIEDYRLSFNHRFIHKNETISEFLLEGTFSRPVSSRSPVLNLKAFTEIGDIKTDETINLTIYRYSKHIGYQKVFSKVYTKKCDSFLSLRELEIIKLCHEGQSSKMIADKLNLSIHTIKNHKRNCMEKTMTHNITELIHHCLVYRWL